MDGKTMLFFEKHPDALPLYQVLEQKILAMLPDTVGKVQTSQISFYNRHLFACVSFLKLRKKEKMPPSYLVLTLGLPYPLNSPKVEAVVEPYPNRWTHHIIIQNTRQIDSEILNWICEAAAFSNSKR